MNLRPSAAFQLATLRSHISAAPMDQEGKIRLGRDGTMEVLHNLEEALKREKKIREPETLEAQLEKLRKECGYDEEQDTGVDSLIDYKNALETYLGHVTDAMVVMYSQLPSSSIKLLIEERHRQEKLFGGPDHDDMHSTEEWTLMILEWLGKAAGALRGAADDDYRERLIQVGALALAGIESFDRKNGQDSSA